MQHSSATPKNKDVGNGLWKIVACSHSSSQCLLVSTVFGTVSSLHPTSFLNDFYTCFTNFLSRLSLDCSAWRDDVPVRIRMYAHVYPYCACTRSK